MTALRQFPGDLTYLDLSAGVALTLALVVLVIIDLKQRRLPDRITLPLIALGLLLDALHSGSWPVAALTGAALGYGVFWIIGTAYFRWRGQEGLGLGDAKLLGAAGAWLGPLALPWVVLIAASGAIGFVMLTRRDPRLPLAFGPWLALGFWTMWVVRLMQP